MTTTTKSGAVRDSSGRITHQTIKMRTRWLDGLGDFVVNLRFDDSCRNGHETFTATCEYDRGEAGGAAHDEIARHFPELAPFLKWHLCSTDGPMNYPANVIYFAGDRDHNGLRALESRQIKNGKTGKPCWILEARRDDLPKYVDADERPTESTELRYIPLLRVGEGKDREFDVARRSAIWPEATDEELSAEPAELRRKLTERLPALLDEFKRDMLALGFEYPDPRDPCPNCGQWVHADSGDCFNECARRGLVTREAQA